MYILYVHTFPNSKVYVGITSLRPTKRWQNGEGYRQQPLIYKAIKKYGWNNVKHDILFKTESFELIQQQERHYITEVYHSNQHKFGYNIQLGGLYKGFRPNRINKNVGKKLIGEKNANYGKHWWTNGIENVLTKECPGKGWYRGISNSKNINKPSVNKGLTIWTNGKVNKYSKKCPGKNWIKGAKKLDSATLKNKAKKREQTLLKRYGVKNSNDIPHVKEMHRKARLNKPGLTVGMKWYNNGIIQTLAKTCPEGFASGMLPINHAKKWYNNGKIEVLDIKVPGNDFILGRLKNDKSNGE